MENKTEAKDLASLTVKDIEAIVDHPVKLQHPNGLFEAKVARVSKLRKYEGAPGREQPFSIIFECEGHVAPVQASVNIHHEKFGLENVLVTPILKAAEDKDKNTVYFEAIFG